MILRQQSEQFFTLDDVALILGLLAAFIVLALVVMAVWRLGCWLARRWWGWPSEPQGKEPKRDR